MLTGRLPYADTVATIVMDMDGAVVMTVFVKMHALAP